MCFCFIVKSSFCFLVSYIEPNERIVSVQVSEAGYHELCWDHRVPALKGHSYLSATIGSTFIARRAGTRLATIETPINNTEIATNVSGSVALTPKSRVAMNFVRKNEATTPIATPINAN